MTLNNFQDVEHSMRRPSSRLVHSIRLSTDQASNAGLSQLASTRNSSITGSPLCSELSGNSCFTADSSAGLSESLTPWASQNTYTTTPSDNGSYCSGMSPLTRQLPQPSNASNFGSRGSMSSTHSAPRQNEQLHYSDNYDMTRLLPEGGYGSMSSVSQVPIEHRDSTGLVIGAREHQAAARARQANTYQHAYDIDTTMDPSSTYLTTSNQSIPYTRFPNASAGWDFWNPRNTPINEPENNRRGTHQQEHRHLRYIQARPQTRAPTDGNRNH